jgi:hypothetical protein
MHGLFDGLCAPIRAGYDEVGFVLLGADHLLEPAGNSDPLTRYHPHLIRFCQSRHLPAARGSVVIGDVDPRAEGTASDITAAGGKAVFQKTDVSDSIQVQALNGKYYDSMENLY